MPLDNDRDQKDRRREQVRLAVARNREMMDNMTRLEQAAYRERKALGDDYEPYGDGEREEAEAIRELLVDAQERARSLNALIKRRLQRDSADNEAEQGLLARFRSMADTRIDVMPF